MDVKAHAGWVRNNPAATKDAVRAVSCVGVIMFESFA
jgi:hypothetical protein